MRKFLLYVILLISQFGYAAQDFIEIKNRSLILRFDPPALDELKLDQKKYKKYIRSLSALVESGQCDPKSNEDKSTENTYYYYGCFIYLGGKEFIIFSKYNHNHAYTIQDPSISRGYFIKILTSSDIQNYKSEMQYLYNTQNKSGAPQFDSQRHPLWKRFTMMGARNILFEMDQDIISIEAELENRN